MGRNNDMRETKAQADITARDCCTSLSLGKSGTVSDGLADVVDVVYVNM